MAEADGCLKNNSMIGASACIRKPIYELTEHEKAEGGSYDAWIKSLKAKRPVSWTNSRILSATSSVSIGFRYFVIHMKCSLMSYRV